MAGNKTMILKWRNLYTLRDSRIPATKRPTHRPVNTLGDERKRLTDCSLSQEHHSQVQSKANKAHKNAHKHKSTENKNT